MGPNVSECWFIALWGGGVNMHPRSYPPSFLGEAS
jgi:hypothetical protein